MKLNNFFTSGLVFDESMLDLKSRYQMVNIAILLSSVSLLYAVGINLMRDTLSLIPVELLLVFTDMLFLFLLRVDKKYFEYVTTLMTAQFTVFFIFLVYTSNPSELKHIWLFTYPIIILYFQGTKRGVYWFILLMLLLIISPFQSFVEVQYSVHQVTYIAFALMVVSLVTYFYQLKMNEAKNLILNQQNSLKEQIGELEVKDRLLSIQSKQAVMGEMISMIAHQWRQPLSTITLQISNLEIRKLLGEKISVDEITGTFHEINNNIMYLSETIDDFQTYFHPDKESVEIEVHKLLDRAVNFVKPRLKDTRIQVVFEQNKDITITTYMNELIQVVLNLLNNAIDALVDQNSNAPRIVIKNYQENSDIFILVKDSANGIPTENLPHIFAPYFSTKGKNGTGLGLYMSQMIIQKQFNGDIEVHSSPKGTIFTIRVPQKLS